MEHNMNAKKTLLLYLFDTAVQKLSALKNK